MRAVVMHEFGPPAVLVAESVPDPEPAAGERMLDIALASVTFVETQIRAGRPPNPAMLPSLPAILGNGVAGTLDGRTIVSTTGGRGGYAERVVVDPSGAIDVPSGVSMRDAIALLADGRTAIALMDVAGVEAGATVLVEAAAGGVGSLLVQLARNAGARVVAVAGGDAKLAIARDLGAHVTADYKRADWTTTIGPVDVVFDGVGGAIARDAYALVRRGGRFVAFGMASGSFFAPEPGAERTDVAILRGAPLSPDEMRAATERALQEAAAGRLRPVIGQTFRLERAADAHAAIEARATTGKTLLEI